MSLSREDQQSTGLICRLRRRVKHGNRHQRKRSIRSHTSQMSRPQHTAGQRIDAMSVPTEALARRAYGKFIARGCIHGFEKDDWAAANRELVAEAFGAICSTPRPSDLARNH
jgi:Protein of unknown function (DUF2934)